METPSHVTVIGGGLSGLSFALALTQVNIPCSVYESRDDSYAEGGGITLSPNALRVLDRLGVFQRVKDKGNHFDILSFVNDAGETTDTYYFGSVKLYGYQGFRIMRQLMLTEMKTMLQEKGISPQYNKKFTRVVEESDGKVIFEVEDANNKTEQVTTPLLVGADGIHSSVRKYLTEEKPFYSGFTAISSVVPRSSLRIPDGYPLPATVMSKAGAFLLVPQEVDGSQLLMGTQRKIEEKTREGWEALLADKQGLKNMLAENKDAWPDIAQSAIENAPVEEMGIWPFYMIKPLQRWASESDRVVILGDAAHAIPPTAGQGVNQAFEDVNMLALLLSKLSSKVNITTALDFWQKYRGDRVKKVLELTMQMNVKRMPPSEQAKQPPGSIWKDESATRGEGGQLAWLYNEDLDAAVEKWIQEQESK